MNTLGLFNVLHISMDVVDKYQKAQESLDTGIFINIEKSQNLFEEMKYQIKKNVMMVDDFISNEMNTHQYQIHSLSNVIIQIVTFDFNKTLVTYEDTFDKVIQEMTHSEHLIQILEESQNIVVTIKVLEKHINHLKFDEMVESGKYSEDYLNYLFHQLLREFKVPFELRDSLIDPIFIHRIEKLSHLSFLTNRNRDNLKYFLETKNLNFLFLTIKDNFWINSNF